MCKVSIIIPCYNVASKLLHRCMASIEAQTLSDYEVIVVDDGSTAGFTEVFDEIASVYSNVSIYHQKNKGVSAARNFGLERSIGKFIVFVDADDYLLPAFLQEAVETAESYDAGVVMGMNITTYNPEIEEAHTAGNKEITIFEKDEVRNVNKWMLGQVLHLEGGAYLGQGPWNRLVDRHLAASTPFDDKLPIGEDIVWNLQLLQKSKKVCIANRVWYAYYMNPSSSSRKYRENAIKESRDSLMEMKIYLDMGDDDQYLSYCLRCWSDLKRIYRCYLSYGYKSHSRQEDELFTNEPWNELGSKRFKDLCGFKYKFMRRLYVSRMLFKYYHIKTILDRS